MNVYSTTFISNIAAYCNTKDSTNKIGQMVLAIPLTIYYLYYVLYNTSLEYNSYTAFTVFFFFVLVTHLHVCT